MHTMVARSVLALVCLAGIAPAAWGVAVYSTSAGSAFAIGVADAVEINSDSGKKTEVGTGSASFGHVISADGVLPATIGVAVSGSASAPPSSFATSTYMAGHVIRIDNTLGTSRISVSFTFSYLWTTAVSVDDPLLEFASSGVFFGISGFEPGIDSINIDGDGLGDLTDTPGTSAWLFNPTSATSLGETGSSSPGVIVTGAINVEAGMIGEFSVITDTTGVAAAVPEPATLALVALGLLATVTVRRRRPPA